MKNTIGLKKKVLGWILFLLYLCFLVYLCFFAESMGRTSQGADEYRYNLVLFREIQRYYIYRETMGIHIFILNIIGNVVAFIPFGFFRPIIGIHKASFMRTLLSGAIFSLIIEISQLLIHVGSFDVDDIFLNTLGTLIGYITFLVFRYGWRVLRS